MASFRADNELNGCKFWKNEWERRCRISGEEPELADHVFERFSVNKRNTEYGKALKEYGSGICYLMGIE